MEQNRTEGVLSKEAMQALRAERKDWIAGAAANAREHRKAFKTVREFLTAKSATVPEIAEATGLAPDKALWLLATMKKFGEVVEAEKDGGFYRYALAGEAQQAKEA